MRTLALLALPCLVACQGAVTPQPTAAKGPQPRTPPQSTSAAPRSDVAPAERKEASAAKSEAVPETAKAAGPTPRCVWTSSKAGVAGAYFILAGDEYGAETYWVASDGRTALLLGWSPDVWLTFEGGVYRAVVHDRRKATPRCDLGEVSAAGEAVASEVALERVDAPGRIELLSPASIDDTEWQAQVSTQIVGLAGPYVALRRDADATGCGSTRLLSTVEVQITHLATQRPPKLTLPARVRSQALTELRQSFESFELKAPAARDVAWAGTLFDYGRGHLEARYVFRAPIQAAASNWGADQYAVQIEGPAPSELSQWSDAPFAVMGLSCQAAHIVGFSAAPTEAQASDVQRSAFRAVP